MNLLICVKQIPDTSAPRLDSETGILIRGSVPAAINPYDAFAVEAAARIKDQDSGTKIVVLSMGPESAENTLRECLAIAADRAYLVSDQAFRGSDTLMTGYILMNAIRKIEELEGRFDAIFCGKQTTDGGTAHIGPQIAEYLDYPQVTCVLECKVMGERMEVLKEGLDANQVIGVKMPCVLTFTKPEFDPRFPTIKRKMAANRAVIPALTMADMPGTDFARVCERGSAVCVKKIVAVEKPKGGMKIDEGSVEKSAVRLVELLSEARVI